MAAQRRMPARTRATINARREAAVRRGVRGCEEVLAVEPLVTAGDDMEVGVRFGRESWKDRDNRFSGSGAYCFQPMAFEDFDGRDGGVARRDGVIPSGATCQAERGISNSSKPDEKEIPPPAEENAGVRGDAISMEGGKRCDRR